MRMIRFVVGAVCAARAVCPGAALADGANYLSAADKAAGWRMLWDGRTSAGWVGAKDLRSFPSHGWTMKDGVLTCLPDRRWEGGWKWTPLKGAEGGGGGDICTVEKFRDFELEIDFRIEGVVNSGIKYFYNSEYAKGTTLEYQILDPEHPVPPNTSAEDFETRRVASLYYFFPAHAKDVLKRRGEWNTARIVSKGRHVEHWLNGVKVLEFERGGAAFRTAFEKTKWNKPEFLKDGPWGEAEEGRILLQDHSDKVSFRNIRIRRLDKTKKNVIRLYPTVLKGGARNLLAGAKWKCGAGNAPKSVYGMVEGGPTDALAPAWRISTEQPFFAYWEANVNGIQTNRLYLAGAWVRLSGVETGQAKERILFEWKGVPVDSDKDVRRRLFHFSGYSSSLARYFDNDLKRLLAGDPDEWRAHFRTFRFPVAMRGEKGKAAYGFYNGNGRMTFSEPFFADITDAPRTLELEISGTKPVKSIEVLQADTRDQVWRKDFKVPVSSFSVTLPARIDAFYSIGDAPGENQPIVGHAVRVTYADGSEGRTLFPTSGLFTSK